MNYAYHLAVGQRSRSLELANRAKAAMGRIQVLSRPGRGLGVATMARAICRAVPTDGEQQRAAGVSATRLGPRGLAGVARRSLGKRDAVATVGSSGRMPIIQAAGAALGAKAAVARGPLLAKWPLAPLGLAVDRLRATGSRRGGEDVTRSSRLAARSGVTARFSASKIPRTPSLHGSGSHLLGRRIAEPMLQRSDAPGFNRTVRQERGAGAPGHVYLDKALVGYHLAAAITAEQTRAASRPNISGSGFNSSMAALRPSGAGL